MQFDWDDNKAVANAAKHGISFEEATEVFYDPHVAVFPDEEHSYNEQRMKVIGASRKRLLVVVYVEKVEDLIRIISAWEADKEEKKIYYESWL